MKNLLIFGNLSYFSIYNCIFNKSISTTPLIYYGHHPSATEERSSFIHTTSSDVSEATSSQLWHTLSATEIQLSEYSKLSLKLLGKTFFLNSSDNASKFCDVSTTQQLL